MKAVILAGGLGTRLGRETQRLPKPMVEVGRRPLLWHVMKIYAAHGITDFIVCLGYRGSVIKNYFQNYCLQQSDVTFDLARGEMQLHRADTEPWRVTLVDTGPETATGGRLRRILHLVDGDAFCFTYGDGVGDVDVGALCAFHERQRRLATVTAVRPPPRFGALELEGDRVARFEEKPQDGGGWINGGFFVLSPGVAAYLEDDGVPWEATPLERIARDGQLMAFRHLGFWHPLDTPRDRDYLEALAAQGKPPWLAHAR